MPNRQQDIIWTNDGLFHWHIYASLGLNELTHQPLGDVEIILKSVVSKVLFQINILSNSCEIALRRMLQNPFDEKVNIGSGNGLMPSGSKPLPDPIMLTQIYVTILHHKAMMG